MEIITNTESNNNFQIGELLKIVTPEPEWNRKISKKVSNLIDETDPEFIIIYEFNDAFQSKQIKDKQIIGKRAYVPSGTSCLYLACDIISTKSIDPEEEEDIIFELHRVLIESKIYWVFDIFLEKN